MNSVWAGHITPTSTKPEREIRAGIELVTSWQKIARSTDWVTASSTQNGSESERWRSVYSTVHWDMKMNIESSQSRIWTTIVDIYSLIAVRAWFGWFLNVPVNNLAISRTGPKTEVLTILRAATQRQSGEIMTSVSAGHIILTPTQPVGSGWPQRGSNSRPPHQESRALSTELPHLPPPPFSSRESKLQSRNVIIIPQIYIPTCISFDTAASHFRLENG